MKKSYLLIPIIALFVGCGSNVNEGVEVVNLNVSDYQSLQEDNLRGKEIVLGGMSGPYPETIKDKKLGEGLLNNYYKKIETIIINEKLKDREVKIAFKVKKKNKNTKNILKGLKQYFARNENFLITFDGPADVVVSVLEDENIITFKIKFINKKLFGYQEVRFVKVATPIDELQKEAFSKWSKVTIPTKDGRKVTYLIMKNPVMVSEFYPNKLTKTQRAVTQVSFEAADIYCTKQGGSIAPLYVFEYALREGKIIPATKYGANKEMVAAFDEANDEDTMLRRPGDVVKLVSDKCDNITDEREKINCYAEEDYSNMLIFNYITEKYKSVDITYQAPDLTFRCIKGE